VLLHLAKESRRRARSQSNEGCDCCDPHWNVIVMAGKYIAVSEGDVFVAEHASEARRLASEKHPDDEPFGQFIPRESRERIYAY